MYKEEGKKKQKKKNKSPIFNKLTKPIFIDPLWLPSTKATSLSTKSN
jgi:hypothetical protein